MKDAKKMITASFLFGNAAIEYFIENYSNRQSSIVMIAQTAASFGQTVEGEGYHGWIDSSYFRKVEADDELSPKAEKTSFTREDMIHALVYGYDSRRTGNSKEKTIKMYREDHL